MRENPPAGVHATVPTTLEAERLMTTSDDDFENLQDKGEHQGAAQDRKLEGSNNERLHIERVAGDIVDRGTKNGEAEE